MNRTRIYFSLELQSYHLGIEILLEIQDQFLLEYSNRTI